MLKLKLSAHLFDLLPENERQQACSPRTISLNPGSWEEVTLAIQKRFPILAERVLTTSSNLTTSCVLAVNNDVIKSGYTSLSFHNGDEIAIIAAMAGG